MTTLVLGIASLFTGIMAGIPAIILGFMAKSEIRKSDGRLKGEAMATAGLVLGFVSVGITFILFSIISNYLF